MSRTTVKTFKRARGTKESEADPRTKLRKGLDGTRGETVTAPRRRRKEIRKRSANAKPMLSPVHCGTRAAPGFVGSEPDRQVSPHTAQALDNASPRTRGCAMGRGAQPVR